MTRFFRLKIYMSIRSPFYKNRGLRILQALIFLLAVFYVQEANSEPAAANHNYVANLDSMKFHIRSCQFGQIMARKRRVYFQTKNMALAAGMSPCAWCQPRYWTEVKAEILKLKDEQRTETGTTSCN